MIENELPKKIAELERDAANSGAAIVLLLEAGLGLWALAFWMFTRDHLGIWAIYACIAGAYSLAIGFHHWARNRERYSSRLNDREYGTVHSERDELVQPN